jgi:Chaperone of endosialidase
MKTLIPIPSFLIALILGLACVIAFAPKTQAVSPAPDGGYPGGNTAEGQAALLSLTTGGYNTAVGFLSLRSNMTNSFNTAIGAGTLLANTAENNTATGAGALLSNTTGGQNTANGAFALSRNVNGSANTAMGYQALSAHLIGSGNNAVGLAALGSDQTGVGNNAFGGLALTSNLSGMFNTAVGDFALGTSTGSHNIALGADAGFNLTTGDYNIDIGNEGVSGEANTIRIGDNSNQGATFIAGIYGVSVSGLTVVMDSSNRLGTVASSRRFKKEIKPMEQASEAILSLKPVTFHYKSDKTGTPQFGLIAEEVAEVSPDLVVRDKNGEIYTVRYDAVNAMLLNEFLKEHRKVEQQQATITELKSTVAQQKNVFQATVAQLTARLDEQASQIQKVSAQLEASKPAQQVVNNP